jgi:hypothetical protein
MTREKLEKESAVLQAENAVLRTQLQLLMGRMRELEGRLARESHNRSKPPSSSGLMGLEGLLIRCFLHFKGKPFVVQPDDNCDDYACGQERTQSNPQAFLRKERRAAVGRYERTRTRRKGFLNRRL